MALPYSALITSEVVGEGKWSHVCKKPTVHTDAEHLRLKDEGLTQIISPLSHSITDVPEEEQTVQTCQDIKGLTGTAVSVEENSQ